MEGIKEYIITLVSMMIIITSIEFIAPDNSMKKYIKFVMGLILIAIMLTPVIDIFTKDVSSFSENLENYLSVDSYENYKKNSEKNYAENDVFKKNLEDNCKILLEEKFQDLNFELDIDCDLDSKEITYTINKIKVLTTEKGTKKIQKVIINKEENSENEVENKDEIINYLVETFKVPKDKIEIY